jgi:hypothetical protein
VTTGGQENSHQAVTPSPSKPLSKFERGVDLIADVPWGLLTLVGLAVAMSFEYVNPDDVRAFATAAGLLGVGHGIHTGAKNFAKRQDK